MAKKLGRILRRGILEHRDLKACGALIYAKNTNRVLFLLRDTSHNNTWGLVGGKCETDESILEALTREINEEINYEINDSKIIPLELFKSQDGKFEYHTFVCVIEEEFIPRLNHEHKGYCWCTIDSFPKPLHPGLWSSWSNKAIQKKLSTLEEVLKVA